MTRLAALLAVAVTGTASAVMAPVSAAGASVPKPAATTLTVDVSHSVRPINRALVGFVWESGPVPLSSVAPLHPHFVRIDGSLQDVSPGPGIIDLADLLGRVATVRAVGAEPMVILSYMPLWLAQRFALLGDRTKTPPTNLGAWQQLVHAVVLGLATAPQPATWFEAWNEPDVPTFWAGTGTQFVDTVAASARAVAQVEAETGTRLHFGGPATAWPDPFWLAPFLARFRDRSLPLDFVSWHYYANYPCLGPNGPEGPGVIDVIAQALLGCRNPLATPAFMGDTVRAMRAMTELFLADSGRPRPRLILDEWNLSAGGLDLRQDTNVGAAFDAATLVALQDAGLDDAAFFDATDGSAQPGQWGVVNVAGHRKPAWWAIWLWQQLAPEQLAVESWPPWTGPSPLTGWWAVASRGDDGHRVTVLLASFSALAPTARTVELRFHGLTGGSAGQPAVATVRRIDADHPNAAVAEPIPVHDNAVTIALPPQAIAFVEVHT